MKKIIFLYLLLLSVFAVKKQLTAQTITVKMMNGNEYINPLDTVQSITFSSGLLMVNFYTGTSENYTLTDVRSILFTGMPMEISDFESEHNESISIYPSPASTLITVTGITSGKNHICIYNLYGALLYDEDFFTDEYNVNISFLQSGIYYIQINNQIQKFIKQ